MPWVPKTDFEEEVVNLQPDHDFIYGSLADQEPQPSYPRPQSHIDFAINHRKEAQKQQELYETTGQMNQKLHAITQIQRIAGTKPLGELPTSYDWDSNKHVEIEAVGMMRHYGMEPSSQQSLNKKVTMATHQVPNNIKIIKNGRKKVPVFFNDDVFKLKPQISNSSSGFDSATSLSNLSDAKDDSISSQCNQRTDTSLSNSNSFNTGKNDSKESNSSMTACKKGQMEEYNKLQEDTASLSIGNYTHENDSFKTAADYFPWMDPSDDYDEYISFNKNKIKWPSLQYNEFKPSEKRCSSKNSSSSSFFSFSTAADPSETSSTGAVRLSKNFLERFITPTQEKSETTSTCSEASFSTSSSKLSYADMAKNASKVSASSQGAVSKSKKNLVQPLSSKVSPPLPSLGAKSKSNKNEVQPLMPRFYTTREIYNMKKKT